MATKATKATNCSHKAIVLMQDKINAGITDFVITVGEMNVNNRITYYDIIDLNSCFRVRPDVAKDIITLAQDNGYTLDEPNSSDVYMVFIK